MMIDAEILVEADLKTGGKKLISLVYDIHAFQNIEAGALGQPVLVVKSVMLLFNAFENKMQWFDMYDCKIISIDKTPDKRRIANESGKFSGN